MRKYYFYNKTLVFRANGFTLAEILITLTIIGIVASLTIPSLINNIGDQTNRAAWKKSYSSFAQIGRTIAANNSGSLLGVFGPSGTNENIMRDYLLQYLSYSKKCDTGRLVTDGCWHSASNWYKLSGQSYNMDWNSNAGFILNNGSLVRINFNSANCDDVAAANDDACGNIAVDVNGYSGPNKIGIDIFSMMLLKNGTLAPFGTQGDGWASNPDLYGCNSSDTDTQGWSCSTQYLYQ